MSTSIKEESEGIAVVVEMDHDEALHPTVAFKLAIGSGEVNRFFSIGEVCGVARDHDKPKVLRALHRLLVRMPATHRQVFCRELVAAESIFVYS